MKTPSSASPVRFCVLAISLAIGLVGCDANEMPTDNGSANLSGAYFLANVSSFANPSDQNLPLPATIVSLLFGTLRVDSGSINFGSGGTYTVTFQGEHDDGSGSVPFTEQGEGTYERRGDALSFYGIGAPTTIVFTGTVDGGAILLVYKLAGLPYEMRLER